MSLDQSPYQAPIEPAKYTGPATFDFELVAPLMARKGWLRWLGILLMIFGGLYTLTIVGALFGVPILFCGIYLFQSAAHFDAAAMGEVYRIREGLDRLTLSAIIATIVFAILAMIMVLYFMAIIMMLGLGIAGSMM